MFRPNGPESKIVIIDPEFDHSVSVTKLQNLFIFRFTNLLCEPNQFSENLLIAVIT